nr:hypothetical protein [Tanacetum cinerariifolium]
MDVKTSFLNGPLKEEQAPRAWYDELLMFLTSKEGFTKGLQIHQSPRGIFINQAKYTLEILHNHGMDKGQSIGTPMAMKPKLDAELSGPVDQTDYRSKIRSLMYLTSSRPDIVQAGSCFELTAFLDADHAGCIDTHKSTSGGIQFLDDKLVRWMSKKQNCTAMSSAEAEYVALSASFTQVMWMRTQLQDYGFNYNKISLYCDSQSAITISCNPVQHSRTKHIHTRTEYQLADMFTKALPKDRFKYLVRRIVLRYDEDECDKGRMLTKIELTLEQSQQGVINDVLVSIKGIEELKRNVWIKGENKAALPTLKEETRENVGTQVVQQSGILCYNCIEYGHVERECQKPKQTKDAAYHMEKMLLCKQEEDGLQLNAEQADWKDDIDDEPKDQELEVHYMHMAQIQEVAPDAADNFGPIFDAEPLQKVQNNDDNYNVFGIKSEHPHQPESINDTYLIEQDKHNMIIDSLDMSYDREHVDQDDGDLAKDIICLLL